MSNVEHLGAADLYARLGVTSDASTAQINSAYRRLARTLHPDSADARGGDPETLRLVIEAHKILSDPHTRQRYDSKTSPPRPALKSAQVTLCGVCRGTGTIARPCDRCAGTGRVLANAPWLRAAIVCPVCHALGHDLVYCGACAGTGRNSLRSSRAETSASI